MCINQMNVLVSSLSSTAEGSLMALRLKFWRKEVEDVTGEQHKQPGLLSDFILGSQDGIVNVLGVILGVAVASQDFKIILAGGLAATFAESISMGAVAYTSTMARREFYLAEYEREKREMEKAPEQEKEEVRKILQRWGVPRVLLHHRVVTSRSPQQCHSFHSAPTVRPSLARIGSSSRHAGTRRG